MYDDILENLMCSCKDITWTKHKVELPFSLIIFKKLQHVNPLSISLSADRGGSVFDFIKIEL